MGSGKSEGKRVGGGGEKYRGATSKASLPSNVTHGADSNPALGHMSSMERPTRLGMCQRRREQQAGQTGLRCKGGEREWGQQRTV